ncbi:MAG: DUF2232 domain-containing protein [Syntrophomonas sp.]|nr:DUF2232 domain-containing protein [Syntrophomonas sp.]
MPGFVYLILISSAACLAMSTLPSLAFVSGIIWGISLLLGGHFTSRNHMLLIFALNILLLYGLAGSSNLFFLLIFGTPSFIMGLLLAAKKGYYELQRWGMVSALLLVSLFIGLAYYNNGDVNTLHTELNQYLEDSIELAEESGFIELYEQQGISPEEMKNILAGAAQWFFMHLPALYYLQAILAVFLVLTLSAYISRKRNLPILTHKPFAEEIMPWQFVWAIIIALALWIWGRDQMTNMYYVGSNLLVVGAPVTVYYGLSSLKYQWMRITPRAQRWALIIFIMNMLVFTLPATIFIGLWGLFDSLLDYRKLNHKKEETR